MSTLDIYKKSFRRRNGSDELDVFEASRYFSDANEVFTYNNTGCEQKHIREENQRSRGGRISLDMPFMRNSTPLQSHKKDHTSKEKKIKPPSSPGGKLASFLNSLFNQTPSKKKAKSKSHSMKDRDDGSGERKRRSSISHFGRSFSKDLKSVNSTSNASGFRSPPPYINSDTPIKAYTTWKSSHLGTGGHVIKPSNSLQNEINFVEGFKSISNGILQNPMKKYGMFEEDNGDKEMKKCGKVDDGWESDSSSDLFELENYNLGYFSSELPVYETTHMDNIKREQPPISSSAI